MRRAIAFASSPFPVFGAALPVHARGGRRGELRLREQDGLCGSPRAAAQEVEWSDLVHRGGGVLQAADNIEPQLPPLCRIGIECAMPPLLASCKRSLQIMAVIGASGCAQPLMNVPEALAGRADMYPVHGRQGLLLFEPQISFGPYRTVSIHREIVKSDRSSVRTGALSSEEQESDRQSFDFVLQGPGSDAWRGRCEASSDHRAETQVVEAHVGTEGSGVTREQTPVSAQSGYVCELDGPAAEHWRLEADGRLFEGTVRDAANGVIVAIHGTTEHGTWQHPDLEGNTLVSPTGAVLGAVQRSFDGAVYLSRELDPRRRTAVAAICAALLIPGP